MDGNNEFNYQQNNQQGNTQQNNGQFSNSNYQDYTANIQYQAPVDRYEKENSTNGLQIASLVCGIIAILSCWCYGVFAIILGIAGLICAIVGNGRSRSGVGIAGLVCSIIGLIVGIGMLIYFIWFFSYIDQNGLWNELLRQL